MFNAQLKLLGLGSELGMKLHPHLWSGSFNARENSMQQLAPYVGRMKTGMARALILAYSQVGDVVLDPFCGSGVVPYESLLAGRHTIGNDLNPYAYVVAKGKIAAPTSRTEALRKATKYLEQALTEAESVNLRGVPEWVTEFFHPKTLRETLALFKILRQNNEHFLMACVLGILHHVRPGFLSYPSSHLVPYLRKKKYPPDKFPKMYAYRDVSSRLIAKINRAYRRYQPVDPSLKWNVLQENAINLSIAAESVNAIISSPPYFGALDYGRDNRLRLWFLGIENYKVLEKKLTANEKVYTPQMTEALKEMYRVLVPGGAAVLVLGDYRRNGTKKDSAETIADLARILYPNTFLVEEMLDDEIPDERRTRRKTRTTLRERILVLRKVG